MFFKKPQSLPPLSLKEIMAAISPALPAVQSPFYDRAEDFPLSEWMMAYAMDEGVRELEDFPLGGLPDLSGLIRFDLSWLKARAEKRRTLFFKLLCQRLSGRILVDLGSGIPARSVSPRVLAEISGAAGYIGVDLSHVATEIRVNEFTSKTSFSSLFVRYDILQFLSLLEGRRGYAFLLSGMELKDVHSQDGQNYCRQLMTSIVDSMDQNSLLILCVSSRDFSPSEFGLKLCYSDLHHEFFVKKARFF